jgi:hypothetical protein
LLIEGLIPAFSVLFISLRVDMPKKSISPIDRRGFLRMGTLLGVLGAVGCDNAETVGTKPDTPPLEKGNQKRLEMLKEKGVAGAKTPKKN